MMKKTWEGGGFGNHILGISCKMKLGKVGNFLPNPRGQRMADAVQKKNPSHIWFPGKTPTPIERSQVGS